jgi:hypothetical protein
MLATTYESCHTYLTRRKAMDMLYNDYVDMINSLMLQAFLHNVEVQCSQTPDYFGYDDSPYDEDDGILIDEA